MSGHDMSDIVEWTTTTSVFGAESHASIDGYELSVSTVITSGDETEVGWFLLRGEEEIDCGYLLPSQSGGLREAFDEGRRLAVEALGKARGRP